MDVTNSTKKYYVVYLALVALTLITCGLSFVPHVGWHTAVGLGIATIKAGLIAVFFMHILSGNRLPWLTLLAGILWMALLHGLTLVDFLTRASLSY
jgi:cytochrome c oxidase subunit IV